ncbi:MAG: helix-turn-helix domain-containing protein, partial [Peptostreptococcaceae bacterium]
EDRKKELSHNKFDYNTYLKREKRLLQYIRLANKEKVINLIPTIFTDIDILCKYELDEIKMMSIELMSLISRAASEAGVQSDICIKIMRKFQRDIRQYKKSEEIFSNLNNSILSLLDMAYILVNNNHLSVLKSARDYIDNNYEKKISIEEVAEHVFMSTSYLCYLFKTKLNCTVNDYIIRVRIEKSIELMKKRELNVNEIMTKVGFSSQSHFTRTFKKVIGVTPGNYRNKFL